MLFRRLIAQALAKKEISQRKASLAVGMNETWVKSILTGKAEDPGIRATIKLARLLEIPIPELIDAIENSDSRGKTRMTKDEELAIDIVHRLSREQLAEWFQAGTAVAERARKKQGA